MCQEGLPKALGLHLKGRATVAQEKKERVLQVEGMAKVEVSLEGASNSSKLLVGNAEAREPQERSLQMASGYQITEMCLVPMQLQGLILSQRGRIQRQSSRRWKNPQGRGRGRRGWGWRRGWTWAFKCKLRAQDRTPTPPPSTLSPARADSI